MDIKKKRRKILQEGQCWICVELYEANKTSNKPDKSFPLGISANGKSGTCLKCDLTYDFEPWKYTQL